MAKSQKKTRVGLNGYGVIGRRVADAVAEQTDMELIGVSDVSTDWRIRVTEERGYPLYGSSAEAQKKMSEAGLKPIGTIEDLLEKCDIVVDCAPKRIGAENAKLYASKKKRFILEGGEKHSVTGHSFVAESNYESALGRESTRVVSCNTTSIVRVLTALKKAGLLKRARGSLLRRATDPSESHLGGIMNTLVPEDKIPSHQGPDAKSVDPDLDVVTMAVKVPETLGHLHLWNVELTRESDRDEVIEALGHSSRIALVKARDGLGSLNTVKEVVNDFGRLRDDLYEVALWDDILEVDGTEAYFSYMVDNQAIVIPETIDAIRSLTESETSAEDSIARTNQALGITNQLFAHV